jgi:hypothetical protein
VCSVESLEIDFIFCIADERESVQKKTFQKWVNSHLVRVSYRITDLYVDLRDGKMLLKLLEVLSGERLVSSERCVCLFSHMHVQSYPLLIIIVLMN